MECRVRQVAAPGAKSEVSDCILFLCSTQADKPLVGCDLAVRLYFMSEKTESLLWGFYRRAIVWRITVLQQ